MWDLYNSSYCVLASLGGLMVFLDLKSHLRLLIQGL